MDSEVIDIEMAYWRAINAFASETAQGIAKKVIWRLMRIKASGVFGDDYTFKSAWDEVCHNIQNGSFDDELETLCDAMLRREIDKALSGFTMSTRTLLALANPNYSPEEHGLTGEPDHVYLIIIDAISEIAGSRDLYRFELDWE